MKKLWRDLNRMLYLTINFKTQRYPLRRKVNGYNYLILFIENQKQEREDEEIQLAIKLSE